MGIRGLGFRGYRGSGVEGFRVSILPRVFVFAFFVFLFFLHVSNRQDFYLGPLQNGILLLA